MCKRVDGIIEKPGGLDLGQAILIGEMCCVVLARG